MTSEQFVTLILAILGIILQLALKYAPRLSEWYQKQENKGVMALALSALIGVAYLALSCTPFALDLKISLTCSSSNIFILLEAIFKIAMAQQATYLYTRGK